MWTLAGGTDTGRENRDAKSRNEGKRRKKEIKRVRDGKEEWKQRWEKTFSIIQLNDQEWSNDGGVRKRDIERDR